MAKRKKKSTTVKNPVSDVAYLRAGRARKLPIHQCFITKNWQEAGKSNVLVSRIHSNGNLTVGLYLVDLYCIGVKDTWYLFNISSFEYDELIERFHSEEENEIVSCDYNLAHNVIFAGYEYAEEFDIEPHSDFKLTRMILEEDNDQIPLLEIQVGYNGSPWLITMHDDPQTGYYLKQLRNTVGEGNFTYNVNPMSYLGSEFDDENEIDDWSTDNETLDDTSLISDREDLYQWSDYTVQQWKEFIASAKAEDLAEDPHLVRFLYEELVYEEELKIRSPKPDFDSYIDQINCTVELIEEESAEQLDFLSKFLPRVQKATQSDSSKEKKKLVKEIERAFQKLPESKSLTNNLSQMYTLLDHQEKSLEIAEELHQRYPDYILAMTNLAQQYFRDGYHDKFEKLMENREFIWEDFPKSKAFHILEVTSYISAIVLKYIVKQDMFMATFHLHVLEYFWDEYEIEQPIEIPIEVGTIVQMISPTIQKLEEIRKDPALVQKAAQHLAEET